MKFFSIVAAAAVCLSACGSDGSNDIAQSDAEVTSESPTSDSADSDSGDISAGPIFYLDAAPGCYAATSDPDADVLIDGIGKEFYPRDCSESHSLEIFWSGDVDGFDGEKNLTQEDAEAGCIPRYVAAFGVDAPRELISPEAQLKSPYIYWFFPDDGLEASQFPGRLVCGVFLADDEYTRMLSRRGSLISQGV